MFSNLDEVDVGGESSIRWTPTRSGNLSNCSAGSLSSVLIGNLMLPGIGIRMVLSGRGDATQSGIGELTLSGIDKMMVFTSGTGDLTSPAADRPVVPCMTDPAGSTMVTSPMSSGSVVLTVSTIDNLILLSGVTSAVF